MRLERHWSQYQIAEMSGVSIRTIQRIENAGFESLKSLAAVFEINIADSKKKEEMEAIRKEGGICSKRKGIL
jgi:transcriptional regulator with XRE-family HTH domain|tara:strand:- start:368 stop:583 length:216 start_codon:yes stop_codon:yes gene_type:complete